MTPYMQLQFQPTSLSSSAPVSSPVFPTPNLAETAPSSSLANSMPLAPVYTALKPVSSASPTTSNKTPKRTRTDESLTSAQASKKSESSPQTSTSDSTDDTEGILYTYVFSRLFCKS